MTKQEILALRQHAEMLKSELNQIAKTLENVEFCEECGEESENVKAVIWYKGTSEQTTLNTCPECQHNFRGYIG
jgi:hypothetical protein